jgi:hypothetical protein
MLSVPTARRPTFTELAVFQQLAEAWQRRGVVIQPAVVKMGETAVAPAIGRSMLMSCGPRRQRISGWIHLAPPLIDIPSGIVSLLLWCLGNVLLSMGNLGHVEPRLFADCRQGGRSGSVSAAVGNTGSRPAPR